MSTITANEKFDVLARLSNMMGSLHEEQATQLKLYGIACSSAVKTCELIPDLEKKRILYVLEVEPSKMESNFSERISTLKRMVSVLTRGWECSVRLRQHGTFVEGE